MLLDCLPPPKPDFSQLRKVLLRQGEPSRLPLVELLVDREMVEAVLGERVPYTDPRDHAARAAELDQLIKFWYRAGYDYITVQAGVPMVRWAKSAEDTAPLKHERRNWDNEGAGPIMTWAD